MHLETGFIQACSAVVLVLATFLTKEVETRLPPKLLKVASGASKALYARGYGYSVIPIPQKILLQTNVARREVHHNRPPRRTKKPRRGKRPSAPDAAKYQDYSQKGHKRRPSHHNHDYQEEPDEDFEYDERPYGKEFEELIGGKHYEYGRKPPGRSRYRDEDGAYSENKGFVYGRRQRPSRPGRPSSSKLYSAAIALPPPGYREESEYEDEEDEYNRETPARYRDDEDDEEERYYHRDRYRDWSPDEVYHDRTYETKREKLRRGLDDKQKRIAIEQRKKKVKIPEADDNLFWEDNNRSKFRNDHRFQNQNENNRWKNVLQLEEQKWKESMEPSSSDHMSTRIDPVLTEPITIADQGRFRNPASLGIGHFLGKEPSEEWREPDIITKQNVGKWEERRQQTGFRNRDNESMKEESDRWVKEHSVGYGIEIDGGNRKKKVEHQEPDVVYGQSGHNNMPRVPELGREREQNVFGNSRVQEPAYAHNGFGKSRVKGVGYEQNGFNKQRVVDLGYDPNGFENSRVHDPVFEQNAYTKPRVPDLGYGQGMELVNDKNNNWQVYLR